MHSTGQPPPAMWYIQHVNAFLAVNGYVQTEFSSVDSRTSPSLFNFIFILALESQNNLSNNDLCFLLKSVMFNLSMNLLLLTTSGNPSPQKSSSPQTSSHYNLFILILYAVNSPQATFFFFAQQFDIVSIWKNTHLKMLQKSIIIIMKIMKEDQLNSNS